jgi:hypothetical protein
MDPGPDAFALVPDEVVLLILAKVGPRSVKRFGWTCRRFRALAGEAVWTRSYAADLVRRGIEFFAGALRADHSRCPAADLQAKCAKYARQMANLFAGRPDGDAGPVEDWTRHETLRFLYPMALDTLSAWALAPYALEWCALFERRILAEASGRRGLQATFVGVRAEVLPLLRREAPQVLEGVLAVAKSSGWQTGIYCTNLILAAYKTVPSPGHAPLCQALAKTLAASTRDFALRDGQTALYAVLVAAVEARGATQAKPHPATRLRMVVHGLPADAADREGAAWFELAGLRASDRSAGLWRGRFLCVTGEASMEVSLPPQPPLEAGQMLTHAILQSLLDREVPPVPAADPQIGSLLAEAAAPEAGAEEDPEPPDDAPGDPARD